MELLELTDNFLKNFKKLKGKDLLIAWLNWKVSLYKALNEQIEPKIIDECLNKIEEALNEMASLR